MTRLEKLQEASRDRHSDADFLQSVGIEPATVTPATDNAHVWNAFLAKQNRSKRPEVYPIVLRHKKTCRTHKGQNPKCECPKWAQPKGGGPESRFSLYCSTWTMANKRVKEYCDARDEERARNVERNLEWDANHHYQRKPLDVGFEEYLKFIKSGKRPRGENESPDPSIKKIESMRDDFFEFLRDYNSTRQGDDVIAYFHQIDFNLLQNEWRPTWAEQGLIEASTINNYVGRICRVLHFAQQEHWMMDTRKMITGSKGRAICECIAHKLPLREDVAHNIKMPFNDLPEDNGGDAEWQMKLLYAACPLLNDRYRPHAGVRLENFIRVMRYSGARIIDVANMAVRALDAKGIWTYQPIKTKYTTGVWVSIQLPPDVVRPLREMPRFHPAYFFLQQKSGKFPTEQNAPDPWHEDIAALWPLVHKRAGLEAFSDSKGNHWGIIDAFANRRMAVSSHSFRNTFAVCSYMKGLTWARIAECMGDTEAIVKRHYNRYTRGKINAVAADVQATWTEEQRQEQRMLETAVQSFESPAAFPAA